MNTQLLQDFESKSAIVNQQINSYRKTPVQLGEIRKSGQSFYYGQTPVAETALKDLLNIFSVKEKLVDEIKDDKDQWEPLQHCLANIKKERSTITAVRSGEVMGGSIVRFFDTAIEEERPLELSKGLELMHSYLSDKGDNIKLQGLYFNPGTLQIETQIRHLDNQIDTFGDGQDLWDSGFGFNYGEGKTQILPYFLRLICTNGMTATHMVNQRYFQSRELKQTRSLSLLIRYSTKISPVLFVQIADVLSRLMPHSVSSTTPGTSLWAAQLSLLRPILMILKLRKHTVKRSFVTRTSVGWRPLTLTLTLTISLIV